MNGLRILAIDPGASYATGDVARGYNAALTAQGHTVLTYDLSKRIDQASEYYRLVYRRERRGRPPWPLVLTKAAADIVPFALYHDVDWVLIHSCMMLHPDALVLLKRAGKRVALLLTESPYDDLAQAKVAPQADVVFTNERTSVPFLSQFNPNTHYLGHAYDPERSSTGPVPADTPAYDVLFIGTLFEERIALLGAVDWTGIDFAIYGAVGLLSSRHRLRKHVRGGIVPNRRAQSLYRAAKINLNPYRTSRGYGIGVEHIAGAESLNPRALELAACGAFSLSDDRAEVREVFGDEYGAVPTYNSAQGLEELVNFYLQRDHVRATIARRGPAAVAGHTYAARAAQLTATLAAHGAARGALAIAAD